MSSRTTRALSKIPGDCNPVLIAIVGYRNLNDVRACLTSLANSIEKNFVVSICENGGSASYNELKAGLDGLINFSFSKPELIAPRAEDAIAGELQPAGQKVWIYCASSNLGYAGGVNVSIRQIESVEKWSALWVLNPDTAPDPRALGALIDRASEGNYSIVSSRLVLSSSHQVQSYGGHWRILIARGLDIGSNSAWNAVPDTHNIEQQMDYVSGASLFITQACVESIGLMDERYFLYCEEVDWCLRRGTHRLGYAHEAVVYHSHGTTLGSSHSRKDRSKLSVYLDERNKLLLTRRFFPLLYPFVVVVTFVLTLQYLKAGAVKNFVIAQCGWLAGVRGEIGMPNRFFRQNIK